MKRLEILSHSIQYRELGSGPTVILTHGYGGMHYDWDEVATILSKSYRVIIPNLTSLFIDPTRAVSFSQQVTIFKELIRTFKKTPKDTVFLAGGSYGATLCYAACIEDSDLVDRVALLNPMPPFPRELLKRTALKVLLDAGRFSPAIMVVLMSPIGRLGLKYIQKIFHVPWIKSNAQKNRLEKITARKAKLITHVVSRFAWINGVEDWSMWENRMGMLKTPVHILWGSRDTLFVENTYVRLSEKFPSCEITRLDGAGHVLMRERPEEVSKILEKFFSKSERKLELVYENIKS